MRIDFRSKEFVDVLGLLSLCHGLSYVYVYALPSTIASNLFFSKTTTQTNFIFCTNIAWVSTYNFVHNSFIKCTQGMQCAKMCQKKYFLSKSSSPEPKVGQKNLIQFWIHKEVLYFICERHLLRSYTFAVAASRLLKYKTIKFWCLRGDGCLKRGGHVTYD
jgi:hypothetical protein